MQIESADALEVLRRLDRPETLFYLDPPYVESTIKTGKGKRTYTATWPDDKHETLCRALLGLKGMAVLSGYQNDIYADMLEAAGWARSGTVKATSTGRSQPKTESL